MMFGRQKAENKVTSHCTTPFGPIRRLNLLCFTGYGYMQGLTLMLSRICQSIGRHFKRSVDTLIGNTFFFYDSIIIHINSFPILILNYSHDCLPSKGTMVFTCTRTCQQ